MFTIFNGWGFTVPSWVNNRFEFIITDARQEREKKYNIEQLLDIVLWEHSEAIEVGFKEWKKKKLPQRLEAMQFHRENCTDSKRCKMCKLEKQWRNFNERTRPKLC